MPVPAAHLRAVRRPWGFRSRGPRLRPVCAMRPRAPGERRAIRAGRTGVRGDLDPARRPLPLRLPDRPLRACAQVPRRGGLRAPARHADRASSACARRTLARSRGSGAAAPGALSRARVQPGGGHRPPCRAWRRTAARQRAARALPRDCRAEPPASRGTRRQCLGGLSHVAARRAGAAGPARGAGRRRVDDRQYRARGEPRAARRGRHCRRAVGGGARRARALSARRCNRAGCR